MAEKKIQRGFYRLECRLSGSKNDIVRVHGMTQEGLVICETAEGHVYRIPDKRNGWCHMLQCTGFDWVEPKPAAEEMVRVKLQKYVEPNGRGDFKFLRTDNEHGAGGYTRVNEWMEIEVPISKL